jgi:hypothetical protein
MAPLLFAGRDVPHDESRLTVTLGIPVSIVVVFFIRIGAACGTQTARACFL